MRPAALLLSLAIATTVPACVPAGAGGPDGGAGERDRARPAARAHPRPTGAIAAITPGQRARMTSWRPGCPVPPADLRRLAVPHWGFDGRVHHGTLVVHRSHARDVLGVMRRLFRARFPIERMEPVEAYGSDDERSMAANNTSAYNCRRLGGGWSEHAYGRAIDINPLRNPMIRDGVATPAAGARFADRSRPEPGTIHAGDVVVRAFAAIGWGWGGTWRSLVDFQHFSASGR